MNRQLITLASLTLLIPIFSSNNIANTAEIKQNEQPGELYLVANGEDFVRQGFTTKDGWTIEFNHIYVTLADVKAYQTDPPFDANSDAPLKPKETIVLLEDPKTVDLALGETDAVPILVTKVQAPPGQYNALSWQVVPSTEGQTLVLEGKATKADQTVNFKVMLNQPLEYTCGEYVGDERKGILTPGGQTELETTFHFDHIFGDAEMPADDPLNTDALGFEPLAILAQNGQLEVDSVTLKEKLSPEDYQTLEKAIANLGHVGEGHCR
jgi:hypothetical protein